MPTSPDSSPNVAGDDDVQAIEHAEQILASSWAKPREIAWAWTVLSDSLQGITSEHSEARYRQILMRHRWILGLSVQTADATGCPTERYRGTPVGGMDRGSDPEDRMLVRVGDIREQAARQGLFWPDKLTPPSVASADSGETISAVQKDGGAFQEPASVENPTTSAAWNKAESAQERRGRLVARAAVLKASHIKAWQKKLAEEEGVSQSRIKQLLSVGDGTKDAPPVATGGLVYRMGKR